jgi:hypothetical protein
MVCTKHLNINEITICDTCGENNGSHENIYQDTFIQLKFNDTEYSFCNFVCLLEFVIAELKKGKISNEKIK